MKTTPSATLPFFSKLLALIFASSLLLSGAACRSVGGVAGSRDAAARSGTVWNVPAPELPPLRPEQKTAYVTVRNISDADINVRQEIRAAVRDAGFRLVEDPEEAHIRLRATVRYFGENENADEGRGLANSLGAVGGAAIGVGTGAAVTGVMRRTMNANRQYGYGTGIAAGAVVGTLAVQGISNRMRAREWNLIVDLLLEERTEEPITFTVARDSAVGSTAGTGVATGRGGVESQLTGGGATDTTTTAGAMERTSNYFPHGMRLTVWARQIGMREDEAMPLMQRRLENVLANVLDY